MEDLVIGIERAGQPPISPETRRHEVTGDFTIRLRNHGKGTHVFLSLGGRIAEITRLPVTNVYVEPDDELQVPVSVPEEAPAVTGQLEVAIGYGSESTSVEIGCNPSPDRSQGQSAYPTTTWETDGQEGGTESTTADPSHARGMAGSRTDDASESEQSSPRAQSGTPSQGPTEQRETDSGRATEPRADTPGHQSPRADTRQCKQERDPTSQSASPTGSAGPPADEGKRAPPDRSSTADGSTGPTVATADPSRPRSVVPVAILAVVAVALAGVLAFRVRSPDILLASLLVGIIAVVGTLYLYWSA